MTTWKKTRFVGVRYRESPTRRHKGKPEKYYSIRYKSHGKTVEEGAGWESENTGNITPQYCSNLRGQIIHNIRTGEGFGSMREQRKLDEAKKKAEESKAITLDQAFESFLSIRTLKPRTQKDYQHFMDSAFKDWRQRRIKNINSDMVSDKHKELVKTIGKAQANQAFRFMRSLLNFCIAKYRGADGAPLIKYNPVLILTETRQWSRVQRRQTIIKDQDLEKWFDAVIGLNSTVVRDYLLTLLLSGLRRNEALSLEKTMVDLEERTISLLDTKNNKPFLIPIPNYLHKVLTARIKVNGENLYVFPSRLKGRHITEPQSGIDAVKKTCEVEFCSHDLRRVFVTIADALDLSPFVIKRLVNHSVTGKDSDTTGGYIVSDLQRLREPVQKIEDRILRLAGVAEPGKVVKLRATS